MSGKLGDNKNQAKRFTRLRLVPQDEYERIRSKQLREYNPELREAVADIDRARGAFPKNKSTIKRKIKIRQKRSKKKVRRKRKKLKNYSETENILRYRHAMRNVQKYLHRSPQIDVNTPLTKQISPRETVNEPESPAELDEADEPEKQLSEHPGDIAIRMLPSASRHRARLLVQFLKRHPNEIGFDNQLQLVLNGEKIIGSNYIDLVHSLYSKSKKPKPEGYDAFLEALHDYNVPRTYLIGPAAAKKGQKGKGIYHTKQNFSKRNRSSPFFKHPPGKTPRILKLYHDV